MWSLQDRATLGALDDNVVSEVELKPWEAQFLLWKFVTSKVHQNANRPRVTSPRKFDPLTHCTLDWVLALKWETQKAEKHSWGQCFCSGFACGFLVPARFPWCGWNRLSNDCQKYLYEALRLGLEEAPEDGYGLHFKLPSLWESIVCCHEVVFDDEQGGQDALSSPDIRKTDGWNGILTTLEFKNEKYKAVAVNWWNYAAQLILIKIKGEHLTQCRHRWCMVVLSSLKLPQVVPVPPNL